MKRSSWVLLVSLSLSIGCSKTLEVKEYVSWNKENKVESVVENKNYNLTCRYMPNDLMALNELRDEVFSLSVDSSNSIRSQYQGGSYFQFVISKPDGTNVLQFDAEHSQEYYGYIEYLSTSVLRDFEMVIDQDTFLAKHHLFERAYAIRPYELVLLYFEHDKSLNKDAHVLYKGPFSNNKNVKFEYKSKEINSIPKLKI